MGGAEARSTESRACVCDGAGAVLPVWRLLSNTVIPNESKYDGKKWFTKGLDEESGDKKGYRPRVTRATLPDSTTMVGLSLSADDARRFLKAVHEHHPEFGVSEVDVVS